MKNGTNFGKKPGEVKAAKETARRVKQNAPVGNQSQLPAPEPRRVAIVDVERETSVQVLYSTVVFRPNQKLDSIKDARLIKIAEENHIPLRYRE